MTSKARSGEQCGGPRIYSAASTKCLRCARARKGCSFNVARSNDGVAIAGSSKRKTRDETEEQEESCSQSSVVESQMSNDEGQSGNSKDGLSEEEQEEEEMKMAIELSSAHAALAEAQAQLMGVEREARKALNRAGGGAMFQI